MNWNYSKLELGMAGESNRVRTRTRFFKDSVGLGLARTRWENESEKSDSLTPKSRTRTRLCSKSRTRFLSPHFGLGLKSDSFFESSFWTPFESLWVLDSRVHFCSRTHLTSLTNVAKFLICQGVSFKINIFGEKYINLNWSRFVKISKMKIHYWIFEKETIRFLWNELAYLFVPNEPTSHYFLLLSLIQAALNT